MKMCITCGKEKEESNFYVRRKNNTFSSYCIECERKYRKNHYKENKCKYLEKAKKNAEKYKRDRIVKILEYLSINPCADCGEKDPLVLQFDHVRGKKKANVSTMMSACKSMPLIMEEIAKCEVRCANCHMRKTAKQFGWMACRIIEEVNNSVSSSKAKHRSPKL